MKSSAIGFSVILGLVCLLAVSCSGNEKPLAKPTSTVEIVESLQRSAAEKAQQMNLSEQEAYRLLVQENPVGTLNAELQAKEADTFAGLWLEHNPEKVIVAFTRDGKKTLKPYLESRSIPNLELRTARITQVELVETSSRLYQFFQQQCLPFSTGVDISENQVTVMISDQALFEQRMAAAGMKLPDYARIEFTANAREIATPPVVTPPAGIALPQYRAPSTIYMMALLEGTLIEENGCLRVVSPYASESNLIIWQPGFYLNDNNGVIEVVNHKGVVAARVGEFVSLGGGGVPGGAGLECYLREPLPTQCSGPYFLMGSVDREPVKPATPSPRGTVVEGGKVVEIVTLRVAPTLTSTPDFSRPATGLIKVELRSAPDSPMLAFFTVNDAATGDMVYHTEFPKQSYTIYLPPGAYTWAAMAPVPTQPRWCYNVPVEYGFFKDGYFTVADKPVIVEVRIGWTLIACTPTPTP